MLVEMMVFRSEYVHSQANNRQRLHHFGFDLLVQTEHQQGLIPVAGQVKGPKRLEILTLALFIQMVEAASASQLGAMPRIHPSSALWSQRRI